MSSSAGHDPLLPILGELEREIGRVAEARLAGRRRPARGPRWHIPRRAAALAALFCLVGASAIATVTIWSEPPTGGNDPIVVDRGTGADPHRLELSADRGRICASLYAADSFETACSPGLRGGRLLARSVTGPVERHVFGLTSAAIRAVEVQVGGETVSVRARRLPKQASASLPHGRDTRFFDVRFKRGTGDPVAVIRPYGRNGSRPLAVVFDCSLGQLDRRCRAR